MAKQTGTVEQALSMTIHHVDDHKANMMSLAGMLTEEVVAARFALVKANLEPVLERIKQAEEAARRGDSKAVLKALTDPVEWGRDYPNK